MTPRSTSAPRASTRMVMLSIRRTSPTRAATATSTVAGEHLERRQRVGRHHLGVLEAHQRLGGQHVGHDPAELAGVALPADHHLGPRPQTPVDHGGRLPLGRRQVAVAARHGQPVGLPHQWAAHDLHRAGRGRRPGAAPPPAAGRPSGRSRRWPGRRCRTAWSPRWPPRRSAPAGRRRTARRSARRRRRWSAAERGTRGTSPPPSGRRRCRRPRRRRRPGRRPGPGGTGRDPPPGRTAAGSRTATRRRRRGRARAARISERCPSWKAPIVGHEPDCAAPAPGGVEIRPEIPDAVNDDRRARERAGPRRGAGQRDPMRLRPFVPAPVRGAGLLRRC